MIEYYAYLSGSDLRSIGKSNNLIQLIKSQTEFDQLFEYIKSPERIIAMRAADVIEKISVENVAFLNKHSTEILSIAKQNIEKELKWHMAQIIPRLELSEKEQGEAVSILLNWVENNKESKIVRVNSLQGLVDLSRDNNKLKNELDKIVPKLKAENIPSINARIKQIFTRL